MTTYDTTTDIGKVRLLIGDTTVATAVFTDAELQVFLTRQVSLDLAAAEALESWAAKYAAAPSAEKMGDYQYSQKTVESMLKLAKSLRDKESAVPLTDWAEFNLNPVSTP